jgi:glycosyltransferase involved in cell wall biosynthesis
MSERIRVVQIIYSFAVAATGGGAARFGIELSRRLDPRRFETVVCGLWDLQTPLEREQMRQLEAAGIEAFAAAEWEGDRPSHSFQRACQGMRSALSRQPVHILHSHSEFGDVAALVLKAVKRWPLILRTVHNGHRYEWRKRPLRRLLLTNALYPLAFTTEIGVNPGIVGSLNRRKIARLLRRQAVYVPNAIDLSRFAGIQVDVGAKRRALGLPPDTWVVGTVGRLVEGKGCESLLQAAAIVLRELPQVHFVLVGEGDLGDLLRERARQLGIADRVLLTGPRSDIEELLACLDLFVSSSLWEGLSTAILEALASRVPVIATDIPANRAIIEDQVNGWLVPTSDPEALAVAVLGALKEPSLCAQCADRALDTVQSFSIDAVVSEHERLYLAALERQTS